MGGSLLWGRHEGEGDLAQKAVFGDKMRSPRAGMQEERG